MRGLAEAAQNRGEDPNNLYTPEELANGKLVPSRDIKVMIIMTW